MTNVQEKMENFTFHSYVFWIVYDERGNGEKEERRAYEMELRDDFM